MWCGEERLDAGPKRGITGLQGGQQSGEEALRVVVLRIEGEPDGGHSTRGEKLGQQRGFAEARRGCTGYLDYPFESKHLFPCLVTFPVMWKRRSGGQHQRIFGTDAPSSQYSDQW